MSLKTLLIVAGVGFLAVQAFRFQARGKKIDNLELALADTAGLLIRSEYKVAHLTTERDKLLVENSTLKAENGSLNLEKQTAIAQTAVARANAVTSQQHAVVAVGKMSALQKKQAADAKAGGIGPINTTVEQEDLNGDVASLKGQLEASETTVGVLTSENGQLRAENGTLKDENNSLKGEVSDLERVLNKTRNADADRVEVVTKKRHPLGVNFKRDVKNAVNDIRAGRTNE